MEEHEAFLTRTIVGAPFCALLGRRQQPRDAAAAGLAVDLRSGRSRLTEGWNDLVALGRANDERGRPRSRPGALQRWLERHALVIAIGGLAALGAAVLTVLVGARAWH
jgi:hypothetical protein